MKWECAPEVGCTCQAVTGNGCYSDWHKCCMWLGGGGKESGCAIRFDVTDLYLLFGTFSFCCCFPFKTYDENSFHAQLCIYEDIKISVCCEGKGVILRLWLLSLSLCWTKFARLLHLTFPCCKDRRISGRWQVSNYAELNQERNRLTFTFSRLALFDEQWIMNEKILSRSQETLFVILNSKLSTMQGDTSNTKLITQMEKLSSQNSKSGTTTDPFAYF